ncbi:MAG TPA: fructose-6-phosphate aldolase [Firmicutes bacterium]|nr:fructose-6-phosphate aldolase [Bacillota bacterium]
MGIFIDSANTNEVREALRLGRIDGVTTNPSLLLRAAQETGRPQTEVAIVKELLGIVDGLVFVQVTASDEEGMVHEARRLAAISPDRVRIKVPCTPDGLRAIRTLEHEGIVTAATAIFSPAQAYLSSHAGASYVAPYLSQFEQAGGDPARLIGEMKAVMARTNTRTEILAASLKTPGAVTAALAAGAEHVTVPLDVYKAMFQHPLTQAALDRFGAASQELRAHRGFHV